MSSANKKTGLLVLWLAVLGGLFFAISRLNTMGPGGTESGGSGAAPAPPALVTKMESESLARQWPAVLAHATPPRGPADAPYTLAEFGDFQCPQCGKVRPLLESLLQESPKSVNLVFVHCPLPQIHKWALPAAEASEAARAQGKFWPMYDALYGHQDDLEPGYYPDYAAGVGLNVAQFRQDLAAHRYASKVGQAQQFAQSLGVNITPTVLLRDNKTGKVTVYIGRDSTLPGGPRGYPGVVQLADAPPWLASPKTARSTTNP